MTDKIKKPRDKRLNAHTRTKLEKFAAANLSLEKERAAYLEVYKQALPRVLDVVRARFPHLDMLILKRYDMAREDNCFHMRNHDHQNEFTMEADDAELYKVLVPKGGCSTRVYTNAPQDVIDLVQLTNLRHEQWMDAKEKKLWHYKQAIRSTSTFNELAAVWPALEALREEIVGVDESPRSKALSILSADTIAFLQNDNAGAATTA